MPYSWAVWQAVGSVFLQLVPRAGWKGKTLLQKTITKLGRESKGLCCYWPKIYKLEENPVFAQDFNLFLLRMKRGYFDWGTNIKFKFLVYPFPLGQRHPLSRDKMSSWKGHTVLHAPIVQIVQFLPHQSKIQPYKIRGKIWKCNFQILWTFHWS